MQVLMHEFNAWSYLRTPYTAWPEYLCIYCIFKDIEGISSLKNLIFVITNLPSCHSNPLYDFTKYNKKEHKRESKDFYKKNLYQVNSVLFFTFNYSSKNPKNKIHYGFHNFVQLW